jgi:PhzF family phenazine biosynthesis protein
MSSPLRYFIVDAFTDRPFSGNPAAVVPLSAWPDDGWLQNVALEMNLSETAYLVPVADGYRLRWFTPKVEVDLCGHATLASAAVLAHLDKLADGSDVGFTTRSGILRAARRGGHFQLDFPVTPAEPTQAPRALVDSLNVTPRHCGRSRFDYLVEVQSEEVLRSISPDFKLLATVDCRGVIVTAKSSDPRFDFVSRFFAPASGIDEDPVTGSAHCCLADHWSAKLGKAKMIGYQASLRGGVIHVELHSGRVLLGGEAVIVAQGHLVGNSSDRDCPNALRLGR